MKTKFFRKAMKDAVLLFTVLPFSLSAQNGITISNFSANTGSPTTLTFDVQWVPLPGKMWSDTAWVFINYNNAGTMARLPLITSGAT
jgi:hypothetical protein